MADQDPILSHDKFAAAYDAQVKEYDSYGHDVLFGMVYEYVKPGDSLLDLGIGTGLSSVHFARAGLSVTGLDGSSGMLEECRKKGFTKDLRQIDLRKLPLPFEKNSFSHVICCGVFHFFGDLLPVFQEAHRLVNPGGIFAFTAASWPAGSDRSDGTPGFVEEPTAWGVSITKHSDPYIAAAAEGLGLAILKEQKVLAGSGDDSGEDILFKAVVTRKPRS